MLKQGSFLCHLFIWFLLPQFNQPLSPNQCDSCGEQCWKCMGSTEVPYNLQRDLEILYLSDNVLDLVNGRSFNRYRNIRELYLNNCSLKTIPSISFSDLSDLELLDLSHNKISDSFPETVFQANVDLTVVFLNYNNFLSIKPAFLTSGSIQTLHMIGNNITEISSDSFKNLPKLEELNLEKNRLKIIPPHLFSPLKHFSRLFLDPNIESVQSCPLGLRVFVGGNLSSCPYVNSTLVGSQAPIQTFSDIVSANVDPANSDITNYTTGGNGRDSTNRKVTTPTVETREDSKITEDDGHSQRTTPGLTKPTTQLATGGKTYFAQPTPVDSGEPVQTFPNGLSAHVEIKMMYLILITAVILLVTLIIYVSIKRCSCHSRHSSQGCQQLNQPQIILCSTEPLYDNSMYNDTMPAVQLLRATYVPLRTLPPPGVSNQIYRPLSTTNDHVYEDIIYR